MTWQDEAWEYYPVVPMISALEIQAQHYRDNAGMIPEGTSGWWVLYPDWMWEHREQIKERWVHAHADHAVGNLRGFYFLDQPGRIGQKFTYDPTTGEWDR